MEIRLLWDIFRDRFKLFFAIIAVFLAIAVGLSLVLPKSYRCSATVKVEKIKESALFISKFPNELTTLDYVDKDNVLGSIELFMKNDTLIREVIVRSGVAEKVKSTPSEFSDPGLISIYLRKRGIKIESNKDSEVFSISGYAPDPEEAERIANTFIEVFFDYYSSLKQKEMEQAHTTYLDKSENLRKNLEELDNEELIFRHNHNLGNYDTQLSSYLQQIADAETENYDLRSDIASLEKSRSAVIEALEKNPEYLKASETLGNNEVIAYLKQEIARTEAQLALELTEKTDRHPDVRQLKENIQSFSRSVDREKEKVFSSMITSRNPLFDSLIERREEYSIKLVQYQARLSSNSNEISQVKTDMNKLLTAGNQLKTYTRRRTSLENIFNNTKEALALLEIAMDTDMSNFLLLNKASAEGKKKNFLYAPKPGSFIIVFGMLGLFTAFSFVILLEYSDSKLRLFPVFEHLLAGTRAYKVRTNSDWGMICSVIQEQRPSSIGILSRGVKKTGMFSTKLTEELENEGATPILLSAEAIKKEADSLKYEDVSTEQGDLKAKIMQKSKGQNMPVIFDAGQSPSSRAYSALLACDLIVYAAQGNKVAIEQIKADMGFFREAGSEKRILGIYHAV